MVAYKTPAYGEGTKGRASEIVETTAARVRIEMFFMESCVAVKTRVFRKSYRSSRNDDGRRTGPTDRVTVSYRTYPFFNTERTSRSSPSLGAADISNVAQSKL